MMARVVIRKPEIPCFVLNSQVRVADWEQVCGTHQGQRQLPTPRLKAGHRTVLTNRVINAFYPCNADAIHTGQTGLLQPRLLLAQKLFGYAVSLIWLCSTFPRSGRRSRPKLPHRNPTLRCCLSFKPKRRQNPRMLLHKGVLNTDRRKSKRLAIAKWRKLRSTVAHS